MNDITAFLDKAAWYVFKDGYWQCDTGAMQVSGLAKKLYDALLTYASSITDESKSSYIAHVNKMGRLNVRETMIRCTAVQIKAVSLTMETAMKYPFIRCQAHHTVSLMAF